LPQIRHHQKRLLYLIARTRNKKLPDPDGLGVYVIRLTILLSLNLKLREISDEYRPESVIFYVGDPKEPAVQRLCYIFWLLKLRY